MSRSRKGHIKLHRKILDWKWFKHPPTVVTFITILETVEWRKNTGLKPGQIITTQAELMELTGLSRQQIRTALEHLISTKEITIEPTTESTKPASLITVENWRFYQARKDDTNQGSNQGSNQSINQSTLYKEEEEVKEGANGGEFEECVPMPEEFKAKLNAMFSGRKVN